jgi:protein TonB
MQSLIHSLNIGTMATWLSVAGFGTVGVVVPHDQRPEAPMQLVAETVLADADFTLGQMIDPGQPDHANGGPEVIEPTAPPEEETIPAPPEMPELADFDPLPKVPELPARATAMRTTTSTSPVSTVKHGAAAAAPISRIAAGSARGGSTASAGTTSSGTSSTIASRLAAGHMPAPGYPSVSRRMGQTGTVIVEFTVDRSGRVISAHAAKPSPWPLLDQEAVRTVRKWKFPPGDVMKLQRPIVFQLR